MTATLPHRTCCLSLRRRLRREAGQSLVEFAVVLPIFIVLILGILYFSRYENYANQETQLAEQGARWAAINVNPGTGSQTLQQYIVSQASGELANGSGDVTTPLKAYIYYSPSGQTASLRVCLTATVTFPTPIGVPTTVVAEYASMHTEQPRTNWTADATPPSKCPA